MPITPTDNPNILRVSFPTTQPASRGMAVRFEAEVVCLLQLTPGGVGTNPGMQIEYQHHLIRSRSGTVGPMDDEQQVQLELTPSLICTIEAAVKEEFWDCFHKTFQIKAPHA